MRKGDILIGMIYIVVVVVAIINVINIVMISIQRKMVCHLPDSGIDKYFANSTHEFVSCVQGGPVIVDSYYLVVVVVVIIIIIPTVIGIRMNITDIIVIIVSVLVEKGREKSIYKISRMGENRL